MIPLIIILLIAVGAPVKADTDNAWIYDRIQQQKKPVAPATKRALKRKIQKKEREEREARRRKDKPAERKARREAAVARRTERRLSSPGNSVPPVRVPSF